MATSYIYNTMKHFIITITLLASLSVNAQKQQSQTRVQEEPQRKTDTLKLLQVQQISKERTCTPDANIFIDNVHHPIIIRTTKENKVRVTASVSVKPDPNIP